MMNKTPWTFLKLRFFAAFCFGSASLWAADGDGIWSANVSGDWGDSTKWNSGQIANGAGYTANLSIISSQKVTLNGVDQTIGILKMGSAVGNANTDFLVSTGGAKLIMDNAGAQAQMELGLGKVNLPIVMTEGGLKIVTTGSSATVNGTITLADLAEDIQDLTLGHDGGINVFSVAASISEGNSAGQIRLVIDSANTVGVGGTNSFTGGVLVRKGVLSASVGGLSDNDVKIGDGLNATDVGFAFSAGDYYQKFVVNTAGSGAVSFSNSAVITTLSGDLELGRAATMRLNNNATMNISGNISGNGVLTVTSGTAGASTLTLSGNNSFAGFEFGYANMTLNIQSATALGSGAVGIGHVSRNEQINLRIDNTSGAALTLTANNTFRLSNLTFVGSDDLNLGNGSVTVAATTAIMNVLNKKLTIGGTISGTKNFGNAGAGTLVLSGINTYSGATYVGGTLSVGLIANGGVASNLGQGVNAATQLVINRGTLTYTGAAVSTDRLFTIGNGGGGISNVGTGAMIFSNTNNLVSTDSVSLSFTTASFAAGATIINVGPSTSTNTTANLAVGQSISGAGIAAGSVILEILDGSRILISNPTSAASTATTYTFSALDRTFTLSGTNNGDNTLSGVLVDSTTKTLGVTKSGAGKWILSGVNTYTGATTVSAGTLVIASTGGISNSSAVTVGAGGKFVYNSASARTGTITLNGSGSSRATLGGSGAINTALTLNNLGDTLSPGNSPGSQTFGVGQSWDSFTYVWETNSWLTKVAGTNFDQISITGSLALTGTGSAYALDLYSLTAGNLAGLLADFNGTDQSWTILTATTGITGFNAANWAINAANFQTNPAWTGTWSLAQAGNSLVLSYSTAVIPEPNSLALLAVGVGMVFLLRRSRRHS